MLFEISFARFKDEIKQERLNPQSRNKIEVEDLGDTYAFYFTPVGINKSYTTVILKEDLSDVDRFYFAPIALPARRITDSAGLMNISDSLNRLEEEFKKISTSNPFQVRKLG